MIDRSGGGNSATDIQLNIQTSSSEPASEASAVAKSASKKQEPNHQSIMSAADRQDVVAVLKEISRSIASTPWCTHLQLRSKARVPIITFSSSCGVEGDVGIDGYAGTDTSDYSSKLVRKFPETFADIVLVLKIFLKQQGLEKPFTGGVGSFKL